MPAAAPVAWNGTFSRTVVGGCSHSGEGHGSTLGAGRVGPELFSITACVDFSFFGQLLRKDKRDGICLNPLCSKQQRKKDNPA